ncbi:hypothetical protein SEA_NIEBRUSAYLOR_102 [Mycobacterium phage NiebruSaylor]|uniref:Uncharacterized protein n=4 Tax=Corndogvirus TaxID=1623285 RepID=A0A5P8DDU7_BPMCO|nr:hypothetical protein PBI_CATDAWG_103 [Mycobacterium phage Catdawg]YP_010097596.1 hypothetical protein KNU03_gp106 [Mycobacterium phage Ryadel]AII28340.1 hypothetical protein PBI_YUNGJAMAL_101 [Mycobacterium phage YungJamal]AYQ98939.1 hypothetical protein SEA_VORRPS_102 [Mycobacterium phage Vorrps]QFP96592.1 hypothetical protein SEA_SMOOCH_101 [Mycobacterium phage Smooch]QOC59300.1 hypothetical protein SEA_NIEBRUSAYLOR_102 [Mycobacterium phage NiebruSaylor]QPO16585.1 hypothetical protein SE
MIVATPPGGRPFYSNDGQLFSDDEITIYSPAFLPEDTELTSTKPGVWMTLEKTGVHAQVVDTDSGSVMWDRTDLSWDEAFEMARVAVDELTAKVQY